MAGEIKTLQFNEGTEVTSAGALPPLAVGDPTDGSHAVNQDTMELTQQNVASIVALKAVTNYADGSVANVKAALSDYTYDSGSSATPDDDEVVKPNDITLPAAGRWLKNLGGGGGGGGSSYTGALAGEDFLANDTAYPSEEKTLTVDATNCYLDIDEGSGEVSVQITAGVYLVNDLGTGHATYDLAKVIEDLLDASALTLDYTISYSTTTRKFTLAAASNFSILWKTGAHGSDNIDTHIGDLISFDDSSNDTGASSYLADDTIDDTTTNRLIAYKTDAAFNYKSSMSFSGFVTDNSSKGNEVTVSKGQIEGFTGLIESKEYYTMPATIVIDSTNNKVDFDEGGGELTATITSGSYDHPYADLVADIKTQMDAAGATYFISYDYVSDKFTIASSSNFTLKFLTGTNNANTIATILGYTKTDKSGDDSFTSENRVGLKGSIGTVENTVASSQLVGFAVDSTKLFSNIKMSDNPVINEPLDFLTTPIIKNYSSGLQLIDEHINDNGYGVRLFLTPASGTVVQTYKLQHKDGPNMPWIDCSSTIPFHQTGSTKAFSDNYDAGIYGNKSHVFVDENNVAFAAVYQGNATTAKAVSMYHSTDLNTWSYVSTPWNSGTYDSYLYGVYAVGNKAVAFGGYTNNVSHIVISTNTGSGYNSWSSLITFGTASTAVAYKGMVFIQYFPLESGINQHRIMACYKHATDFIVRWTYCKGDGTGVTTATTSITGVQRNIAIDESGLKNKCVVSIANSHTGTTNYFSCVDEIYNGGTPSINNYSGSSITISAALDSYNGYSSADGYKPLWNELKRGVVLGNYCYFVDQCNNNPSSAVNIQFIYSKNVSGGIGTWLQENIGDAAGNCQEVSMQYIPSLHALLVVWKLNTNTLANNLVNGQCKARLGEILADGSVSWHDIVQIDGGKSMSGALKYVTSSAWADGANVSWEEVASNDIEKNNIFI